MAKYYVELTVRLEYDVDDSLNRDNSEEVINDQLDHLVDRAYGNGQFTGDTVARIDEKTTESKRIFKASIRPGTPTVKSVYDHDLANAIAWCEDNFNN